MAQKKRALIISCFDTWYYNRIEPISRILESREYQVKIIVSDYHHIKKEYIKDKCGKCIYTHVLEYKKNMSIARIISHLEFGRSVNRFIKYFRPDLLYLLVPPNNIAVYCNWYKKRNLGCKYIVDLIDLWPESMPLGAFTHTLPAWIWKKFRDDSLKSADYVFTECKLYQRNLKRILNPSRTNTLYLYKEQKKEEQEQVQNIIAEKENTITAKSGNRISFAYLGSINNIVDTEGICSLLKFFQKKKGQAIVEVIGVGENQINFIDRLKRTGAVIHYHGAVYEEREKIRILASCDFAFNMMKDTSQVGLTIKSIDYMSYGLPLINNIKGDTWKLVEKYGIGVNINEGLESLEMVDHRKVLEIYNKKFAKEVFVKCVEEAFSKIGI